MSWLQTPSASQHLSIWEDRVRPWGLLSYLKVVSVTVEVKGFKFQISGDSWPNIFEDNPLKEGQIIKDIRPVFMWTSWDLLPTRFPRVVSCRGPIMVFVRVFVVTSTCTRETDVGTFNTTPWLEWSVPPTVPANERKKERLSIQSKFKLGLNTDLERNKQTSRPQTITTLKETTTWFKPFETSTLSHYSHRGP